jgi:uncharacterized protein with gpF-like domain
VPADAPNNKTRNRAKLIARDQHSKFAAALNRTRSAALGAEHYQWRSVRDARVRDDHQEWNTHYFRKDGKEVDKAGQLVPGGKDTGGVQPGDEVNCRCSAAWVLM